MSNMSYCRFRNTLMDLHDCHDALDDGSAEDITDTDELRARDNLIKKCQRIAADHGED